MGILGGAGGTGGGTDCHSQCAHWLRNDREFYMRCGGGPSGKSAKRCQWQRKRAGFEEVPRLADTTVTGNRLARRWATAGPYGSACRGGRPCPPSPGNATLCRAGPVCPAVGEVRNPPVTASPCQPPLGKGAVGTGVRIATAGVRTGFAMTGRFTWGAVGRAAALHQGSFLQRSSVLWTTWATLWPRPG